MANVKNGNNKCLIPLMIAESVLIAYLLHTGFFVVTLADTFAPTFTIDHFAPVIIFAVFIVLSQLAVGLYEPKLRETFRGVVRRIFVAQGIAFFAMAVFTELFLAHVLIHSYYLVVAILMTILGSAIFRFFVMRFGALGLADSRIVILGTGERAAVIENRMRRAADRKGFQIIGFIPLPGDTNTTSIKREPILDVNIDDSFKDFIADNEIDEVVIAADQRRGTLPIEVLFDLRLQGIKITDLLDFMERESGQILVNMMYPSWLIFSGGFHSQNHMRRFSDYAMNFVLASLMLLLVWPIMLLTALAIYLDDGKKTGASVFYKQVRVGKEGELFSIFKFRSMGIDAEKNGAQWTTKNDLRVTRVGGFIRKYRLDELPQLLNVIRGDMSFVGPRPERPEFVEQLNKAIPFYNQRHNVKPGLAGWAQLNYPYGASVEDAMEKLKFDLYYVKHQSFTLDILVLARTVEVVLFGKGR
ncbi:MAG: TIGR03013 family XrtA/PEP-CTERM system glycosyltransferase [Glaciecola sp.]